MATSPRIAIIGRTGAPGRARRRDRCPGAGPANRPARAAAGRARRPRGSRLLGSRWICDGDRRRARRLAAPSTRPLWSRSPAADAAPATGRARLPLRADPFGSASSPVSGGTVPAVSEGATGRPGDAGSSPANRVPGGGGGVPLDGVRGGRVLLAGVQVAEARSIRSIRGVGSGVVPSGSSTLRSGEGGVGVGARVEAAVGVHVLGPGRRVRQRGNGLGGLAAGVQHRHQGCGRRGAGMRGHQLAAGCGRAGGTGELIAVQLPVVVHDQFGAGQRVRADHGGGDHGCGGTPAPGELVAHSGQRGEVGGVRLGGEQQDRQPLVARPVVQPAVEHRSGGSRPVLPRPGRLPRAGTTAGRRRRGRSRRLAAAPG